LAPAAWPREAFYVRALGVEQGRKQGRSAQDIEINIRPTFRRRKLL
jgi:hypothetical protein